MLNRIKKITYTVVILFILNFSVIYLQSCQQDFVNSPNTPTGSSDFPDVVKAVFNTPYTSSNLTCTTPSCHASGTVVAGELDLTDWQKTMNGSENGTMVIPYNAFWSHMVSVINADTLVGLVTDTTGIPLPGYYHKIGADKVNTISSWINDGAKNKGGQVAFSDVSNNDKGFITNQASDLVAVVRPNEKQIIRLIPVGGIGSSLNTPHYVKISSDNKYFYISLISAGYLQKYDVNTYTQVGSNMQAGQSPAHIVISPDDSSGYFSNFSSDHISCGLTSFNTNTMTVTGTINDQRMPGTHGLALSSDGHYLYATSQVGEYIFKMNTSYFTNTDSLFKAPIDPSVPPNGNGTGNFKPYQCTLSPDNSLLWVTCTASHEVRIYNSSDLSQVNSINVGLNPLILKFNNDGRYVFVCNRNDSSVTVINAATQTVQATVRDVGVQPHSVDFTSDGQYAIIACETQAGFDGHHPLVGSKKPGTSRIIRISDFTLLPNKLEMGSFPAGIAIIQ